MAHWEFCGTPWTSRSQARTARWSSASRPDPLTSATHSSSVRPVRSCIDPVTAAIMSAGSMAPIMCLAAPRPPPDPPPGQDRVAHPEDG